jgi:hypothetical protein
VLREFVHVKQENGPGRRRWFETENFELVVWLDGRDEVEGYQICYDLGRGEHALTWRPRLGFRHDEVDSGDEPRGGGKMTPILIPKGAVPWTELTRRFETVGGSLESGLRELVGRTLAARR